MVSFSSHPQTYRWFKNLVLGLKCLTKVLIGPLCKLKFLLALSLASACWDEHQDKHGLASIGLLWCISHPRPCPVWAVWWRRSHISLLTDRPMDPETECVSSVYLVHCTDSLSERIYEFVSHHHCISLRLFLYNESPFKASSVNDEVSDIVKHLKWHILKV